MNGHIVFEKTNSQFCVAQKEIKMLAYLLPHRLIKYIHSFKLKFELEDSFLDFSK